MNRAIDDESVYFKRRKQDADKFVVARDGDWIIAPFQCEHCWFVKFCGKPPNMRRPSDRYKWSLIRRANLDIFWSREKATVTSQHNRLAEIIRRVSLWGWPLDFLPRFPPRFENDASDMMMAMLMLEKSREPGRNANYTQYDTLRQFRSAISNVYGGSGEVGIENGVLKTRRGEVQHLHNDPMQSSLMERFMVGMKNRMPVESQRNLPLLGTVVAAMLELMGKEAFDDRTDNERSRKLIMCGGYIAVTYGYSLRGYEGFWVDGDRLIEHINLGAHDKKPHVVIALLGRFKAEGGDRMHTFVLSNETGSGVRIRHWLEKVVEILRKEKKKACPAFCDEDGYMLNAKYIEKIMHPILKKVLRAAKNKNDMSAKDIEDSYRCGRSFRRGAENTALLNGVDKETINFVHRWSEFESKAGKTPGFNMLRHYAEGVVQRPLMLKFTAAI